MPFVWGKNESVLVLTLSDLAKKNKVITTSISAGEKNNK